MQGSDRPVRVLRYLSGSRPISGDDGRPDVSVVVPPCQNDEMRELINRLSKALGPDRYAEILLFDNGSAVSDQAVRDDGLDVVAVRNANGRAGRGGAVAEGLRLAKAPWAVVLSADPGRSTAFVPRLLDAMEENDVDLVVAARSGSPTPLHGLRKRYGRVATAAAAKLAQVVLGEPVATLSDPLSGLFAVRMAALRLQDATPLSSTVLLELIVRFDLARIAEVPYTLENRFAGPSRYTPSAGLRYVRRLIALRSTLRQDLQLCEGRATPPPSVATAFANAGDAGGVCGCGAADVPSQTDVEQVPGLNVLVITSEAPPVVSGIARCVDRLSAGLTARGHRVDIISSVQIPRVAVGEWRISSMLAYLPRIVRTLHQYDVVNLHGPVPTMSDVFLALSALRPLGVPIVYTHHSAIQIRGVERLCAIYNKLHRRIATRASMMMTSSAHYHDLLHTPDGPPVRVAPWGVDLRAEPVREAADHLPLQVLFVGQMRTYKGVDLLLEAVAGQPDVELTLVGSGPHLADYERLADRLGGRNVQFLGRLTDEALHRAYDSSDVVVLPSVTEAEAFGLVVLEGMAAGCVPVVSDLPGVRDLALGNGIVVPPRDIEALRRSILELAKDRDELRTLRTRARRRAEHLSWDACVSRYEEAFYDAIGADDGPQRRETAGRSPEHRVTNGATARSVDRTRATAARRVSRSAASSGEASPTGRRPTVAAS